MASSNGAEMATVKPSSDPTPLGRPLQQSPLTRSSLLHDRGEEEHIYETLIFVDDMEPTCKPPRHRQRGKLSEEADSTEASEGTVLTTNAAVPQAHSSSTVVPPAYACSTVVPPDHLTSTVVPPAHPCSTVVPPAQASSTFAPPAHSTSTVVPPAHASSTVVPPAHASSTVVPPAHSTSTAVPPAHASSTIVPPAHASSNVVPPAHSTSTVVPSAHANSTVVPPAHANSNVVPPAHATQLPESSASPTQLASTNISSNQLGYTNTISSQREGTVTPSASATLINNRSTSQLSKSQVQSTAVPSVSVSHAPSLTSVNLLSQPQDTKRLQPGVSFILTGHSSNDMPFEKEGTIMKLVNNKWKTREAHLKPQLRALFYYQSLADSAGESGARGVYPLLGANVTDVFSAKDGGYMFIITFRNSQMIQFKLPSESEAKAWQVAITLTARQPLPAVCQDVRTGRVEVVRPMGCSARTLRLNVASRYLYTYKKDEMEFLDGVSLAQARIVMEKSYGAHFDISIHSHKEGKIRIRFKSADDWLSWGELLEACSTS